MTKNEIEIAISSKGTKSAADFWKNIHQLLATGVQKQEILKALTETPAAFIAQGENIGTLEKNKVASFTVYNSDPFENKKAKANEIWLKGERKQLSVFQEIEISGSYHLNRSDARFILEFSGPSTEKVLAYLI